MESKGSGEPSDKNIGQVIFGVLIGAQHGLRNSTKLVLAIHCPTGWASPHRVPLDDAAERYSTRSSGVTIPTGLSVALPVSVITIA
jgi:hypothetical protein